MISRDDAYALLLEKVPEASLRAHCLESEAVLRALARRLGQDEALWGVTGLLHDLDYPATKDNPARHGPEAAEMLKDRLPEEALTAIRAHNAEHTGVQPTTQFDFALRCGETVTGLVHAGALVRPTRLVGMDAKSLTKKFKDKAFAAGVNRAVVREYEKLGLERAEFFTLAIAAVTEIASEVGLA